MALIPPALTSRPWVTQARTHGANVAYLGSGQRAAFRCPAGRSWRRRTTGPDAALWVARDLIISRQVLEGQRELGQDRDIATTPAPAGQPLQPEKPGFALPVVPNALLESEQKSL